MCALLLQLQMLFCLCLYFCIFVIIIHVLMSIERSTFLKTSPWVLHNCNVKWSHGNHLYRFPVTLSEDCDFLIQTFQYFKQLLYILTLTLFLLYLPKLLHVCADSKMFFKEYLFPIRRNFTSALSLHHLSKKFTRSLRHSYSHTNIKQMPEIYSSIH